MLCAATWSKVLSTVKLFEQLVQFVNAGLIAWKKVALEQRVADATKHKGGLAALHHTLQTFLIQTDYYSALVHYFGRG